MANECVKSKFNGILQSGSLNKFNKLVITVNKDCETTGLYIKLGFKNGISITATEGIKLNTGNDFISSYTKDTNYDIGFFVKGTTGNVVEIDSVYDIVWFACTPGLLSNCFVTGGSSFIYGNYKVVELPSGQNLVDPLSLSDIRYIQNYNFPANDISEFIRKNPKLVEYVGVSNSSAINDASYLGQLQYLQNGIIYKGNIELLGTEIRSIIVGFTQATGSLDSYIGKRRNTGQNTGCIELQYANVSNAIEYNGGSLKEYCIQNSIQNAYVSWDASNITISGTKPASYIGPDSVRNIFITVVNE